MKKIETEYKLELTKEEFNRVQGVLKNIGKFKQQSSLKDYFFNLEKFDEKGYNFTRIRVYDAKDYERTDKIWKIFDGKRVREETEEKTTPQQLEEFLSQTPKPLSMEKNRTDYTVPLLDLGFDATISLDEVFISNKVRHFIEVEIITSEGESNTLRPLLKQWLLDTFSLSDREEGIGMLRLALSESNYNS